jgi:peptide methionine sulfoxide reductase MsrA
MQKLLTSELIVILSSLGYEYFLYRSVCFYEDCIDIYVTLLPVKYEPDITELPADYETYFEIHDPAAQMYPGIDDVIILVDLTAAIQLNPFWF